MIAEHAGVEIVRVRAGGRCELGCGRPGTNTHHRMRQGRPWNPANLLRVCGAGNASGCHGWIETHPTHAIALGLIVPRGRDFHVAPAFVKPAMFARGWWQPDDDGMWAPSSAPVTEHRHGRQAIGDAALALSEHLKAAA